jgi:hypothetical protein
VLRRVIGNGNMVNGFYDGNDSPFSRKAFKNKALLRNERLRSGDFCG